MGALEKCFPMGIGSGDVLVGGRTEKHFFNAPVTVRRASPFSLFSRKKRLAFKKNLS